MILTVAAVIVDSDTFVDPRLDTSTPIIRNILSKTSRNPDPFELIATNVVPQQAEGIRNAVRSLIERDSIDWILVVGGIGFEDHECTPEVSR